MVEGRDQSQEEWEKYRMTSREEPVAGFNPYNSIKEEDKVPAARPRPKEKRHLHKDGAVGETMRRWTLAMTDVPDEVLLDELERLRQSQARDSVTAETRPHARSRGGKVRSVEGHDGEEDKWAEFGAMDRHGKKKSMSVSGHEFVYGGPKRRGKFNIGSVEDGDEEDECSDCSDSSSEADDDDDHHFISPIVASPSSDTDWTTARRALLCCRDIIRTERSYLSLLHQLTELMYPSSVTTVTTTLSHRTRTLIYTYLPDLIHASEALLARLEDDPSAWGVSAALIGCEEEIESAFIRWCGVVGEVFVDPSSGPPSNTSSEHAGTTGLRSRVGSTVGFGLKGRSKSGFGERELQSVYRPRAVSCYDGVMSPSEASSALPALPPRPHTGLFTAALGTGLALGLSPPRQYTASGQISSATKTSPGSGTLSRTFTHWKRKGSALSQSMSSLPAFAALHTEKEIKKGKGRKVASVRELAIQPTQRVTRYVLQYRGTCSTVVL